MADQAVDALPLVAQKCNLQRGLGRYVLGGNTEAMDVQAAADHRAVPEVAEADRRVEPVVCTEDEIAIRCGSEQAEGSTGTDGQDVSKCFGCGMLFRTAVRAEFLKDALPLVLGKARSFGPQHHAFFGTKPAREYADGCQVLFAAGRVAAYETIGQAVADHIQARIPQQFALHHPTQPHPVSGASQHDGEHGVGHAGVAHEEQQGTLGEQGLTFDGDSNAKEPKTATP